MTPRILALLLGLTAPAAAQEPPPPAAAEASAPSPVEAAFGLRSEYLAGDKILVPITLANAGDGPVQVPDLSSRPWLVSFKIESADGRTQRRRTAAPKDDSGRLLTLAPRARRYTLLEIPSSAALPEGEYTLTISVQLDGQALQAPPHALQVVPPRPVAGQVGAPSRRTVDSVWVHQAAQGFDLYLHQLAADAPTQRRGHWFLGSIPRSVTPALSVASAGDDSSRWVVWLEGGRDLSMAQIQGTRFTDAPTRLTTPWPKVALAAAPMMDGRGRLAIPLWVPAPKGDAGELRVLAFDDRDRPVFRRVATAPTRPIMRTFVDDAGNAHLLVGTGQTVDLYTLRADLTPKLELPVAGRRLTTLGAGERLVDAAFVVLPSKEGLRGGLSVQLAARTDAGVVGRLISMGGKAMAALPPIPLEADATVTEVVPGDWTTWGVVARQGGRVLLEQPAGTAVLPEDLDDDAARWSIVRGADGAPVLLRLGPPAPVTATPLGLSPRP